MSYVKEITTNIKSPDGEGYTVPLGQYTILIGDNEAGKSAIAEAIQLARTGSAHGLLYRDKPIKDGGLLRALIPSGQEKATVQATLDGGEDCLWSLESGGRPSRSGPNGAVLAASHIQGILAGSLETKAKFFWDCLSTPIVEALLIHWGDRPSALLPLLPRIPEHLHQALFQVFPEGSEYDIPSVVDLVGKKQREQASVVKAGQIALESLGSVVAASEDEIRGTWNSLTRALLRDILKDLYGAYRADPTLQASPVISYLVDSLGGKEAITRIQSTDRAQGEVAETLLNNRLTKAAVAAKGGEARAQGMVTALKELKETLIEILREDLEHHGCEFLKKKIKPFLLPGEELHFTAKPNFEIGLRRGDVVHTALSGSTEARFLAALASVLSDDESLIVVDDRMWDADTLAKTMKALEKAPGQVLVMSTIKPKGRKRGKWNYVEISRTPGEPLQINAHL